MLALVSIAGACLLWAPPEDEMPVAVEDKAPAAEPSGKLCYEVPHLRPRPVKDPFALPAHKGQQEKPPAQKGDILAAVPAEKDNSSRPPELPSLTGTIKSGAGFIGLVRFEKGTKAVRCGDFIGAFRVASIDESSLILADAQQNFFTCKLKGL